MEYAKDTEPKGILIFNLDTWMDRKDAVYVRYSYNGMQIHIVLVVNIN